MINKLDLIDKKLLSELDNNSREPVSKLSKKLRINRNVLKFRMDRLVKKEIIRNFVTLIRPNSLGFMPYKFYIKLQDLTKEKEESIANFLKNIPSSYFAKLTGEWDYVLGIFARNIEEVNKIKYEIHSRLAPHISKMSVNSTVEVYQYRRGYFINKKNYSQPSLWIGKTKKFELDEKSSKMLNKMSRNSRASVVDMAGSLNLTAKTIADRIKKLQKENIIYDYRIGINLEKLGFKFFKCLVFIKNPSQIQKFKNYCNAHPNIIHLVECAGEWDFEIAYEIESEEKFSECIQELRYEFKDMIRDLVLLKIDREFSYFSLPLLNF